MLLHYLLTPTDKSDKSDRRQSMHIARAYSISYRECSPSQLSREIPQLITSESLLGSKLSSNLSTKLSTNNLSPSLSPKLPAVSRLVTSEMAERAVGFLKSLTSLALLCVLMSAKNHDDHRKFAFPGPEQSRRPIPS